MSASKTVAVFDRNLNVRCPTAFTQAVDKAAARKWVKPAVYIRSAILDRLKADGFEPELGG
jgi:hypothetical protein